MKGPRTGLGVQVQLKYQMFSQRFLKNEWTGTRMNPCSVLIKKLTVGAGSWDFLFVVEGTNLSHNQSQILYKFKATSIIGQIMEGFSTVLFMLPLRR